MTNIQCREHTEQRFDLTPEECRSDVKAAMVNRMDEWQEAHPGWHYDKAVLWAGDNDGNGFAVVIHGSKPHLLADVCRDAE